MEHEHTCMTCTPSMVPDYNRDDALYHEKDKCGSPGISVVTVDNEIINYTQGAYEGPEGWARTPGQAIREMHKCTCGSEELCVHPVFGYVKVEHV